jgi:hypothetical protein
MNRLVSSFLALSFLSSANQTSVAKSPSDGGTEPSLKITVWVYNYAQVSAWTLIRAERVAASIFRQAGVETLWLNDTRSKVRRQPFGPTILALRIVSEAMAARYARGSTTLGFAVPSKEGGSHASVFYHRVKELAKGTVDTEPEILGHALAHEIGHLLLDSTAHDPTGIMCASWSREDLYQMAWQYLSFSTEQAVILRANVLRRIKLQETLQASRPVSQR